MLYGFFFSGVMVVYGYIDFFVNICGTRFNGVVFDVFVFYYEE